jgi:hypothetical protein
MPCGEGECDQCKIDRLTARIAELEAQLAEARRDSERMDWLEAQQTVEAGWCEATEYTITERPFDWCWDHGQSLRAAIDTASTTTNHDDEVPR